MQKNDYFEILFHILAENNLIPQNDDLLLWRTDFQRYFEKAGFDEKIIHEIKSEFGLSMENVFLINSKKSFLLNRYYKSKGGLESIQASVCFTVLGCLLDHLIDMGDSYQKEIAMQKVNWKYCSEYFYRGICQKENSVIDKLFETVGRSVFSYRDIFPKAYNSVIELLEKTAESELFVMSDVCESFNPENVSNKSVLFSVISTQICVPDCIEESKDVAYSIGKAFAMIDDMCDFYEDMELHQKNMCQILLSEGNMNEYQAVEYMTGQIAENLNLIKRKTDEVIYNFFLSETREWVMSRSELRERVWKTYG